MKSYCKGTNNQSVILGIGMKVGNLSVGIGVLLFHTKND